MLRALLEERFYMSTAVDTRERTRKSLKLVKSGLKLKRADGPQPDPASSITTKAANLRIRLTFRGAPGPKLVGAIAALAVLDARAHRLKLAPVFDETGLTDFYDGEFEYTIPTPSRLEEFPQPESLEDALMRQLGLTLEVRKAPGKVLVIRSSDRTPTEN